MFFNLVYVQTEKDIKQKFSLNRSNKIFSFDYNVTENNPKLFDVIEYQFKFGTCLNSDVLKIKSINFIFNNAERNKTFFENNYEISKEKNLSLFYKILVKDSDKNLKLKTIRCELLTNESNVIFFELHNKTSKEKIINLKNSNLKLLEFKYPKKVKLATGQFYNFEIELLKCEKEINIEDINLRFEVINETNQNNNEKISQNSMMSSLNYNSTSFANLKFSTDEEESLQSNSSIGNSSSNHEFIFKNSQSDSEIFSKFHNKILLKINKIEDEPIKCNFLIQFREKDNFSLKFLADYKIIKKEIYDDHIVSNLSDVINFEVVDPFTTKSDFFCDTYMSISKQKIFPIKKNIKMNFTLTNNLDTELNITEIIIKKPSQDSREISSLSTERSYSNDADDSNKIESPLEKILKSSTSNSTNSFTIRTNSEFNIPFSIYCDREFSGSLGAVVVSYRDKGLDSFDDTFKLCNTIELAFPNLSTKMFDVSLNCNSYTRDNNSNDKMRISSHSEIPFNITLKNNSGDFRRLVFMIDTSNNYLTSGQVKKKLLLYPREEKEVNLSLIPLTYSKLKLPPFKIMEFPLANTTYENKIYSIYYLPDNSMN